MVKIDSDPAPPRVSGRGMVAKFSVFKNDGVAAMEFPSAVGWLLLSPVNATILAFEMRRTVVEAFGERDSDQTTLPIKVTANPEKQIIEMHLPKKAMTMVAHPEMWLALAQRMEEAVVSLGRKHLH